MLDPEALDAYLRTVPRVIAVVRYDQRPWTLNRERRMHRMERAAHAREWREAFGWLAIRNKVPAFERAVVIVQPHLAGGPMPDVDACHPAAKAAIDGLVDAGVLKSDGPRHVIEVRYMAALPDSQDGLSILVCQPNEGATP